MNAPCILVGLKIQFYSFTAHVFCWENNSECRLSVGFKLQVPDHQVIIFTPRKFGITRIVRFKVQYKAPQPLFQKGEVSGKGFLGPAR